MPRMQTPRTRGLRFELIATSRLDEWTGARIIRRRHARQEGRRAGRQEFKDAKQEGQNDEGGRSKVERRVAFLPASLSAFVVPSFLRSCPEFLPFCLPAFLPCAVGPLH